MSIFITLLVYLILVVACAVAVSAWYVTYFWRRKKTKADAEHITLHPLSASVYLRSNSGFRYHGDPTASDESLAGYQSYTRTQSGQIYGTTELSNSTSTLNLAHEDGTRIATPPPAYRPRTPRAVINSTAPTRPVLNYSHRVASQAVTLSGHAEPPVYRPRGGGEEEDSEGAEEWTQDTLPPYFVLTDEVEEGLVRDINQGFVNNMELVSVVTMADVKIESDEVPRAPRGTVLEAVLRVAASLDRLNATICDKIDQLTQAYIVHRNRTTDIIWDHTLEGLYGWITTWWDMREANSRLRLSMDDLCYDWIGERDLLFIDSINSWTPKTPKQAFAFGILKEQKANAVNQQKRYAWWLLRHELGIFSRVLVLPQFVDKRPFFGSTLETWVESEREFEDEIYREVPDMELVTIWYGMIVPHQKWWMIPTTISKPSSEDLHSCITRFGLADDHGSERRLGCKTIFKPKLKPRPTDPTTRIMKDRTEMAGPPYLDLEVMGEVLKIMSYLGACKRITETRENHREQAKATELMGYEKADQGLASLHAEQLLVLNVWRREAEIMQTEFDRGRASLQRLRDSGRLKKWKQRELSERYGSGIGGGWRPKKPLRDMVGSGSACLLSDLMNVMTPAISILSMRGGCLDGEMGLRGGYLPGADADDKEDIHLFIHEVGSSSSHDTGPESGAESTGNGAHDVAGSSNGDTVTSESSSVSIVVQLARRYTVNERLSINPCNLSTTTIGADTDTTANDEGLSKHLLNMHLSQCLEFTSACKACKANIPLSRFKWFRHHQLLAYFIEVENIMDLTADMDFWSDDPAEKNELLADCEQFLRTGRLRSMEAMNVWEMPLGASLIMESHDRNAEVAKRRQEVEVMSTAQRSHREHPKMHPNLHFRQCKSYTDACQEFKSVATGGSEGSKLLHGKVEMVARTTVGQYDTCIAYQQAEEAMLATAYDGHTETRNVWDDAAYLYLTGNFRSLSMVARDKVPLLVRLMIWPWRKWTVEILNERAFFESHRPVKSPIRGWFTEDILPEYPMTLHPEQCEEWSHACEACKGIDESVSSNLVLNEERLEHLIRSHTSNLKLHEALKRLKEAMEATAYDQQVRERELELDAAQLWATGNFYAIPTKWDRYIVTTLDGQLAVEDYPLADDASISTSISGDEGFIPEPQQELYLAQCESFENAFYECTSRAYSDLGGTISLRTLEKLARKSIGLFRVHESFKHAEEALQATAWEEQRWQRELCNDAAHLWATGKFRALNIDDSELLTLIRLRTKFWVKVDIDAHRLEPPLRSLVWVVPAHLANLEYSLFATSQQSPYFIVVATPQGYSWDSRRVTYTFSNRPTRRSHGTCNTTRIQYLNQYVRSLPGGALGLSSLLASGRRQRSTSVAPLRGGGRAVSELFEDELDAEIILSPLDLKRGRFKSRRLKATKERREKRRQNSWRWATRRPEPHLTDDWNKTSWSSCMPRSKTKAVQHLRDRWTHGLHRGKARERRMKKWLDPNSKRVMGKETLGSGQKRCRVPRLGLRVGSLSLRGGALREALSQDEKDPELTVVAVLADEERDGKVETSVELLSNDFPVDIIESSEIESPEQHRQQQQTDTPEEETKAHARQCQVGSCWAGCKSKTTIRLSPFIPTLHPRLRVNQPNKFSRHLRPSHTTSVQNANYTQSFCAQHWPSHQSPFYGQVEELFRSEVGRRPFIGKESTVLRMWEDHGAALRSLRGGVLRRYNEEMEEGQILDEPDVQKRARLYSSSLKTTLLEVLISLKNTKHQSSPVALGPFGTHLLGCRPGICASGCRALITLRRNITGVHLPKPWEKHIGATLPHSMYDYCALTLDTPDLWKPLMSPHGNESDRVTSKPHSVMVINEVLGLTLWVGIPDSAWIANGYRWKEWQSGYFESNRDRLTFRRLKGHRSVNEALEAVEATKKWHEARVVEVVESLSMVPWSNGSTPDVTLPMRRDSVGSSIESVMAGMRGGALEDEMRRLDEFHFYSDSKSSLTRVTNKQTLPDSPPLTPPTLPPHTQATTKRKVSTFLQLLPPSPTSSRFQSITSVSPFGPPSTVATFNPYLVWPLDAPYPPPTAGYHSPDWDKTGFWRRPVCAWELKNRLNFLPETGRWRRRKDGVTEWIEPLEQYGGGLTESCLRGGSGGHLSSPELVSSPELADDQSADGSSLSLPSSPPASDNEQEDDWVLVNSLWPGWVIDEEKKDSTAISERKLSAENGCVCLELDKDIAVTHKKDSNHDIKISEEYLDPPTHTNEADIKPSPPCCSPDISTTESDSSWEDEDEGKGMWVAVHPSIVAILVAEGDGFISRRTLKKGSGLLRLHESWMAPMSMRYMQSEEGWKRELEKEKKWEEGERDKMRRMGMKIVVEEVESDLTLRQIIKMRMRRNDNVKDVAFKESRRGEEKGRVKVEKKAAQLACEENEMKREKVARFIDGYTSDREPLKREFKRKRSWNEERKREEKRVRERDYKHAMILAGLE